MARRVFLAAGVALALADPRVHDEERAKVVEALNSQPGMLWKAGVSPRFQGKPLGSVKDLCGVKEGSKHRLQSRAKLGSLATVNRNVTLTVPESFDSATNWPQCAEVIGEIRDQSNCGCCWAFGAAEAASDRLCISTNGKVAVPLSAQETCFCAEDDGCGGGNLDTAWEYIRNNGLVTGSQYQDAGPFGGIGLCSPFSLPHCHHHGPQGNDPYPAEGAPGCPSQTSPSCPSQCADTSKAPYNDFSADRYRFTGEITYVSSDADAIAQEIMTNGPVEAAFTVYADFENYVSGIYHHTSDESMGGHAIKIVGWGEENGVKYWKVQNSWNPYWGESGYFRILRGSNECGIEDQVVAGSGSWVGPQAALKGELVV